MLAKGHADEPPHQNINIHIAMKKIFAYAALLLAGAFVLTACSDDNESNPTLVQPTEFSLFKPAIGSAYVDLEKSQTVQLSWTIPTFTDFGAPVVPTYVVQVSPTGKFTKEFDRDQKENPDADYISLEQTFNSSTAAVNTEGLDQALQQLLGWEGAEDVPATLSVTIRAIASIRDASFRDYYPIVSSNTITLNTVPYFIISVDPIVWYMVGSHIGSDPEGGWKNKEDGAGVGLIPLLPSADEEYNKATGTGVISYTGFMPAGSQFKFVFTPGEWGTDDTSAKPRLQLHYKDVKKPDAALITEEAKDHNIIINKDGYYVISINTKSLEVTIKAYEKDVKKVFGTMFMRGSFNGWNADEVGQMKACETLNGENHMWMGQLNVTEDPPADGGVKFCADPDWKDNWGSETFPYGTGTGGGANIPYVAGSYTVFLNDITGQYFFIANPTEE